MKDLSKFINESLDENDVYVYENKLVTSIDWASKDVKKGTINIKILGRKTYITVDYKDLKKI